MDSLPRVSLAEKINKVLATIPAPNGQRYTTATLVAEIKARYPHARMTVSYLAQLRMGERENPTKLVIEALAGIFGLPESYFFDSEDAMALYAELELLSALKQSGMRSLLLRARDLSPATLAEVQRMVEHFAELEKNMPKKRQKQ